MFSDTNVFYWLRYLETDDRVAPGVAPVEFDTLGARCYREYGDWLCEVEGAVQWGEFGGQDHEAGFLDLRWMPTCLSHSV